MRFSAGRRPQTRQGRERASKALRRTDRGLPEALSNPLRAMSMQADPLHKARCDRSPASQAGFTTWSTVDPQWLPATHMPRIAQMQSIDNNG